MDLSRLFSEIGNTYLAMAPYLLLGLAFAGILHVVFKKETVVKHLGSNSVGSVVKAALLGVPLPLCSCGVIPTSLSLRKSGASRGAVMSFLISTPQTGVDSIVATYGMLGPIFAVFRPVAALLMGVLGGLVDLLFAKDSTPAAASTVKTGDCVVCENDGEHTHSLFDKVKAMARYAFGTFLDDIAVQLMVGILISGLISFFVPPDFFTKYVSNSLVGMLLMIAVGIPMYVCATASIPIGMALMMKGLSPGAAFVFLAVGPATNAATILLVTRAMGKRFTAVYLLSMIVGSIAAGYALNAAYALWGGGAMDMSAMHHHDHEQGASFMTYLWSALFAAVLLPSLWRNLSPRIRRLFGRSPAPVSPSARGGLTLGVEGMTCSRCAAHVADAVRSVPGVADVKVNLAEKNVALTGSFSAEAVRTAIREAGYTPV